MKIKLSDELELMMLIFYVLSLCINNSYWKIGLSILALSMGLISILIQKIEDRKQDNKVEEEEEKWEN